jgi:hypothetical protein
MAAIEWLPGDLMIHILRFFGLEEWHPGDLLIEALRFFGLVALVGGLLLALLGVLSGSPEPLNEPLDNFGLIQQGGQYAIAGAALYAASWALLLLLGRRLPR